MLKLWVMLLCVGLVSCSRVDVQTYSQEKPTFEVRQFFEGRVEAWGMFQKRSGEVVKSFHVQVNGHSEGDKLILDESFTYSDGTKQKRVWTLTPAGPGQWRGTAGDVVGEARGEVAGNTLRWNYVLNLPVDGKEYEVQLDDWMYMMDKDTLINRSYMTKFGVEVGQITLFFRKQP